MNTLKNSVNLIGRLGTDPQFKSFDSGKQSAYFSLATNETYQDDSGEKIIRTKWHNIIAWGKTAKLVTDLLTKGSEVNLRGRLNYYTYQKDNDSRTITEVVINEFLKIDTTKQASED